MRAHRVLIAVFVLFVAQPAPPAVAWNPLKAAAKKAKGLGRAIGGMLGIPAGGFVESATAPTIRNVEEAGRRLIRDADDALGRQVEHAGDVTSRLIAETNQTLASNLERVDHSLEARILQVKLSANEMVDHAFGRLDRSLGRLDNIARKRIDQIAAQGRDLIARADATALKLLAEADAVLTRRLEDVRQLVRSSIEQADQAAEARLDQLDELAGRRIGNLDVVATKMSLNAERTLLRIASLVAMVAFIGFVLWRLFVEAGTAWSTSIADSAKKRAVRAVGKASPRFFAQVVLAGVGAGILYFLAGELPRNAQERADLQIAQHESAIGDALAAYDFTGVKYHASQLEVLRPDTTGRIRVVVRKAELLQTLFMRPAVLQTVGGIRQVIADIARLEDDAPTADPDIMVIKAYVLWQVGATRSDELEAATLCADALEARPSDLPGGFMLSSLARNYLGAFLHDPYQPQPGSGTSGADLERLRTVFAATVDAESPQFQHIVEFNRLIAELDRASSAAYLDMLAAHADYLVAKKTWKKGQPESAAMRAARDKRAAQAARVVEAWRVFDEELESSPWLADDPTSLAAFTLDDAVLSRALYFQVKPEATDLPGEFLAETEQLSADVRVKTAPLRVAWARRYATLIGRRTQDLLAFEETQRFRGFERRAHGFEIAYTSFLVATKNTASVSKEELEKLASAAILAAAQMGLHRDTPEGRFTEAAHILEDFRRAGGADLPKDTADAVAEEYEARRLRFL